MKDLRQAHALEEERHRAEALAMRELTEDAQQLLSPDVPVSARPEARANVDVVRQALYFLAQVTTRALFDDQTAVALQLSSAASPACNRSHPSPVLFPVATRPR